MLQLTFQNRHCWRCVVLLTACLGLAGCAPTYTKRDTALVQGTVTYNGEPLKMGVVMFQPESGPFASGDIQPNGSYSLEAVVGPNRVQIICRDPEDETPIPQRTKPPAPPKSYIPEKYGLHTSPLQFEVEPNDNVADFALE